METILTSTIFFSPKEIEAAIISFYGVDTKFTLKKLNKKGIIITNDISREEGIKFVWDDEIEEFGCLTNDIRSERNLTDKG